MQRTASVNVAPEPRGVERAALLKLYSATKGANWRIKHGWEQAAYQVCPNSLRSFTSITSVLIKQQESSCITRVSLYYFCFRSVCLAALFDVYKVWLSNKQNA
jgi:hypothetical protein